MRMGPHVLQHKRQSGTGDGGLWGYAEKCFAHTFLVEGSVWLPITVWFPHCHERLSGHRVGVHTKTLQRSVWARVSKNKGREICVGKG